MINTMYTFSSLKCVEFDQCHNREFSAYFPGYNNQALKYQLCIYSAHLALMVILQDYAHYCQEDVYTLSCDFFVLYLLIAAKSTGTPPFFPQEITCKFIFLYLDTPRQRLQFLRDFRFCCSRIEFPK